MKNIETEYKTPLDLISVYRAWHQCSIEDDLPWLERLAHLSREILLTWEPWKIPASNRKPYDQPDFSLKTIFSGKYDKYIRSFAKALTGFPRTVYLRPMHEMNGNWYPWCGTVNDNTPGDFLKAWNHIRDIFAGEGADRLQWVWCPYVQSYPPEAFNRMENYFPGDDVLDWVALDGYNWGATREWSSWQSFEGIFAPAYNELNKMTRRPLMIAETACAEEGGRKDEWIMDAFQALRTVFTRVRILVWFDINKECDWRISSSPEALTAFQTNAGLRAFQGPVQKILKM